MKIVYLTGDLNIISGGNRVIIEHVNGLSKKGHEVELWVKDCELVSYFATDVEIRSYHKDALSLPDCVVLTDPSFIPDAAQIRPSQTTFLLLQHDNDWVSETTGTSTYASLLNDYKAQFSHEKWKLITISKWLHDVYYKKYDLESIVIQNGIDQKLFQPSMPLFSKSSPNILIYYDPQIWKGFSEAVMACLEVKKVYKDANLLILGKYFPEVPKIESQSFGFPFPAVYFNRPPQRQLASIYSSAHVFVSSSWLEGFGLPGLEAMACGVPVVTTNQGGVGEYAINNVNSLAVPPKDVTGLTEAIVKILSNKVFAQTISEGGLKTAAEFNWEKSIGALEKALVRTHN